ncbi:MAG: DNA adenine methylase [Deltaproteobacteria bacterium]|nr:DNA adenine methylase [Deltaproteobacteria bacterium]
MKTESKKTAEAGSAKRFRPSAFEAPFRAQLLKWVGNKQRYAHEITSYFPERYGAYHEPFLGSGAVLGRLAPATGFGSDAFGPLAGIWKVLRSDPARLKGWYRERWEHFRSGDRVARYDELRASYNARPNSADLLFLCRSCYGGVVRFRRSDGFMSTPLGVHEPISPASFAARVDLWDERVRGSEFAHADYTEAFERARKGDLVYCDPPYSHSQSILYGAQSFSLETLLETVARASRRGVRVALSIDGTKKSGDLICELPIPRGLFEREVLVNCGRSMLRRFQMRDRTLEGELVSDRLLLTF